MRARIWSLKRRHEAIERQRATSPAPPAPIEEGEPAE
jgi:hypothetical protein